MKHCGENFEDMHVIENIFCSLTTKFDYVVCAIEDSKYLGNAHRPTNGFSSNPWGKTCEKKHEPLEQVLKVKASLKDGRGERSQTRCEYGKVEIDSTIKREAINPLEVVEDEEVIEAFTPDQMWYGMRNPMLNVIVVIDMDSSKCRNNVEDGVNLIDDVREVKEETSLLLALDVVEKDDKCSWYPDNGGINHVWL